MYGRRPAGGWRRSSVAPVAAGAAGAAWRALRECTLAIPAGHVAALVGPNGAGKTTLLNLAVGLAEPSAGIVTVLGGRPAGSSAARAG